MAVKTKDEILASIKAKLNDDTSDEAIAIIEDVSDTLDDLVTKSSDSTNWKNKFEENDKSWRQKYRDRFYGNTDAKEADVEPEEEEESKPMRFEDLFKEGDK